MVFFVYSSGFPWRRVTETWFTAFPASPAVRLGASRAASDGILYARPAEERTALA